MNESGRSVAALQRFFHIEPQSLLVVHDELDMPPGTVKMKKGGGTGGHNGLEDIVDHLGTKDFWRLRVGIGHPGHKDLVADYVLHTARRAEQELIDPPFERSLDLLPKLARTDPGCGDVVAHAAEDRPRRRGTEEEERNHESPMRHRRAAQRRQVHLFNALTKAGIAAENYPFCTIEPNVGIVEVPDPRLRSLPRSTSP
jgi:hypothetical protein